MRNVEAHRSIKFDRDSVFFDEDDRKPTLPLHELKRGLEGQNICLENNIVVS